ncbi:MAG: XrtA/PEP-CTERM system TPR-repeat protein PrsT [Gammaproteobacteria bacterium]
MSMRYSNQAVPFTFLSFSRMLVVVVCLSLIPACDSISGLTPQEHIEKARGYLDKGDINSGIIELKNALQKDTNLAEARWLLGNAYLKLGAGQAAYKELEHARQLGYDKPDLETTLLQVLLLNGEFQAVLDKTTEDMVKASSSPAAMLALRANAYLGLKRLEEAKSAFNNSLAMDSSSIDARLGLAQISAVEKNLVKARQILDAAQAIAPQDVRIWIMYGQIALLENRYLEAEQVFSKAVSIAPYNMQAQLGLARSLLAQGKYEAAVVPLDRVKSRYPNQPTARYFRSYIAFKNNDKEKAKDILRGILKSYPNHPESLLLLSSILYQEGGQVEQTIEYLTRLVSIVPNHLPAIKLLSYIQIKNNQTKPAIKRLEQVVTNYRSDAQLLSLLGSAYIKAGNLAKGSDYLEQAVQLNPDAPGLRTQLAIGQLASGSREEAISQLETAVKLDSNLTQADILLVLSQIEAKAYDAAIEAAQAMIKKQPDNPLPFNLMGVAYLGKGDTAAAREQFEQALKAKPDFTPAIANLALLDLQEGNEASAEKRYKKILGIDENNVLALVNLGRFEERRGNKDKMYRLLQQARIENETALQPRLLLGRYYLNERDYKALREVAGEAYKLAPNNPRAILLEGESRRLNGKLEEAYSLLQSLANKYPDFLDALYELGIDQLQKGDQNAAKQSMDKILAKQPDHIGALTFLIDLALRGEDHKTARKLLDRIRQTHPEANEINILSGDIALSEGNPGDAIRFYAKALKADESNSVILKLSRAYIASGNVNKARSVLQDWSEDHPDDQEVRLLLASSYQQENLFDKAIILYRQILNKDPNNAMALNNLSWLYFKKDDSRAFELAQKAYALSPDQPEILDTMGWIMVKQNQIEQGLKYLQSAQAVMPESPDIRFHVAAAIAASGNKKRARKELISLLDEHKSFTERKEAEELLTSLR